MDNFYNSVELCNRLLEKRTHCTGTLRADRRQNPREITGRKLKKGEHIWKRKGQVYVSKWKDKREVCSITTRYHPVLIETTNRFNQTKVKPKDLAEYNTYIDTTYMSGIDRVDQVISYYSCPRKPIRWYFIGIPADHSDDRKFVKMGSRHGGKRKRATVENQEEVSQSHFQEKIPVPESYRRKIYHLRCRYCSKNNVRKETSWRCRDCDEKPPLCPGPCFEKWHSNEM
ncbi:PREDICTED: uncharacterized protein LOC108572508 [Habropoda laboriosa]|uniref:uncharacterized protein LOC108572508 n=1 Tax=Habropoda laboriosa TaxID=597456 RepID=UPI00083CA655|nr:PREDICTED: uncharacterized protein LOC108572508 [Habropoda laboriosa]